MNTIRSALRHAGRTAVVDGSGSHRYTDVLAAAVRLGTSLRAALGDVAGAGAQQPRIAIMCEPGHEYVAATWASWMLRGIAVPLCLSHPDTELQYVLRDSEANAIVSSSSHHVRMASLAAPSSIPVLGLSPAAASGLTPAAASDQGPQLQGLASLLDSTPASSDAIMIYTSGTTGRPKGVVHTHTGLHAQTEALCQAWGWLPEDRILHTLPLHHVHGIVCALLCGLESGAAVEFMPRFSPSRVWERIQRNGSSPAITVFMGVPTMYAFLINTYKGMDEREQEASRAAAEKLRLWTSGSAACPPGTLREWEAISGKPPVERYGMTETGIVLSNPLNGERRIGSVGQPLLGSEIRLVGDDQRVGDEGDIRVRSPQLFRCYWRNPIATAESFDDEGYFMTGDTAVLDGTPPYYRIKGRSSVDIIKHGGYKISALDIESKLLIHPCIRECAVVGLPDDVYGEVIAVVAVLAEGQAELDLAGLRAWAGDHLPPYQLPARLHLLPVMPRNAMGKVNKKELRALCFPPDTQALAS